MGKFRSVLAAGLLIPALFVCSQKPASADEGMWLPSLIGERIDDMQEKGFRLGAEDIYSINQASLKDAVVLFGRGCTGEIISPEGLFLPTTTAATPRYRNTAAWNMTTCGTGSGP